MPKIGQGGYLPDDLLVRYSQDQRGGGSSGVGNGGQRRARKEGRARGRAPGHGRELGIQEAIRRGFHQPAAPPTRGGTARVIA